MNALLVRVQATPEKRMPLRVMQLHMRVNNKPAIVLRIQRDQLPPSRSQVYPP